MKTLAGAMQQFVASPTTTLCSMWLVKRVDGTVLAFTDHDVDLTYDLEEWLNIAGIPVSPWLVGTGAQTYLAQSGYTPTDVATSSALNVDNTEVHGVLVSPSITEADLNAGLWDNANIVIYQINWNPPPAIVLSTLTHAGGIAHAGTGSAHGLNAAYNPFYITIAGAVQSQYNGNQSCTVTGPTTFSYPVSGTFASPATGTPVYQVIYGAIIERIGTLGEVTIERGSFKAELRGLMQSYTRSIGEIVSPMCRADLGDARCTVDLTPFTVTSTLTGVGADDVTLYDTARTEPGPTGGISITAVTQANPGVVSLSVSPVPFPVGSGVVISGALGMVDINGNTVIGPISGSPNTFQLSVDTTAYPAYTGGGSVAPLGGDSGYFDGGLITFTSGANAGLSMEVKNYAPGVIVLQLPMPYVVAPGDAYTMHAGCDKSLETCRDRFSNLVNMRAEPYLPGIDKLVQVGRHG